MQYISNQNESFVAGTMQGLYFFKWPNKVSKVNKYEYEFPLTCLWNQRKIATAQWVGVYQSSSSSIGDGVKRPGSILINGPKGDGSKNAMFHISPHIRIGYCTTRQADPFKNKRMLPGAILKCVFITDTKHHLLLLTMYCSNPLTGQNSPNYPYICGGIQYQNRISLQEKHVQPIINTDSEFTEMP